MADDGFQSFLDEKVQGPTQRMRLPKLSNHDWDEKSLSNI